MPLPFAEGQFWSAFAKQDLTTFDGEFHFRVGTDTEAVADVFGDSDLAALSYFHTYKYDSGVGLVEFRCRPTGFDSC